MLINLRNALMTGKRLPYDAEVEYLESTGKKWIDTGVVAKPPTVAELNFRWVGTPSGDAVLLGARNNSLSAPRFIMLMTNQTKIRQLGVGANWATYGSYDMDTDYNSVSTFISGAITQKLNGSTIISSTATLADIGKNLFLFANNSTAIGDFASARVYSCKIYQNGVLVRDYIPVRKGTVGYLYDRVSGKLFGNAGTGDFVLGPDVVPVEYLQSDGGQYIQTDFTPDDSYGFEVDCFTPVASSSYNSRAIGLQNGQVRWLYCTERRALSSSFFGWNEAVSVGSQPDKRIVARCNWLNNRTISIGDTVYKSNLATLDSVGGLKAVLFGINNGGSVLTSQLFVGKMYSAKVSVGNVIGYNYAPIRVGTEGAMMDTLTRRIYRNQGTGAFGYGNDLPYPIPAS